MKNNQQSWSDLWSVEDWWAIWFAAILTIAVYAGIITHVPKIGKWETNPLNAIPLEIIFPVLIMLVGIGLMTTVGMILMKKTGKIYTRFYCHFSYKHHFLHLCPPDNY